MDVALTLEAQEIVKHKIINETIAHGDSYIQQFYAGAVVFITGGSGFLGKQLIEKLFRSCEIKKIFILLRPKKNITIEERWQKMLKDPVYDYVQKHKPNFEQKVVLVKGDVTETRVGISDPNWKAITEEVDIIFHGAATIKFTEPLKQATLINVRGIREMISLARGCKNLRSFVHISTAYSHATPERIKKDVLEQFYDSPISPEELISMVESYDEATLEMMTPKLIEGWPNTYAFTKAVAEELVRTMSGDLPICIVRPAIVIAALREPLPGWIDKSCVFGPSGFVVGVGLGVLHVMYCDTSINLDLIPVDLVNNAIITAACETVERREKGQTDIQIYTVTGTRNPLKLSHLKEVMETECKEYPSDFTVWLQFGFLVKNKILYYLLSFFLHCVPGYFVDSILFLLGKKTMLVKVYDKCNTLNEVLGYFLTNDWKFSDSNLREMYWKQSEADRTIFNCNIDTLDWNLYVVLWAIGIRKYIIKDGINRTAVGVRNMFWLRILHYFLSILYVYAIYKLIYMLFSILSIPFM